MSTIALATLGPAGTDAADLAIELCPWVELVESFRKAMDLATTGPFVALVPCGTGPAPGEKSQADRWVDLVFCYTGSLEIAGVLVRRTKPMCLARRRGLSISDSKSLALHPATLSFALRYAPGVLLSFSRSKVDAVEDCAAGRVDLCIGSCDVVLRHENLEVVTVFEPQMVWTLFARPQLRSTVACLLEGAEVVT